MSQGGKAGGSRRYKRRCQWIEQVPVPGMGERMCVPCTRAHVVHMCWDVSVLVEFVLQSRISEIGNFIKK